MLKRILSVCSLALALSVSPLHAQTTSIERIAPENSVLIVGTRNAQSLVEHTKATPLWSLWQNEKIKDMTAQSMKQMSEGLKSMLKELGVEEDSLVAPEGASGIAVFTVPDPDLGTPQIAILALADYVAADKADKTDKLIQAALERGEKEKTLEVEQKDVGGHTVYSIDLSKLQEQEKGDIEKLEEEAPQLPIPMGPAKDFFKGMKKLHYVRAGNVMLIASDFSTLNESMDKLDGKGAKPGASVSERADFQAVAGKIGEPDVYAVLLTRDIMDIVGAFDQMGIFGMLKPTVRAAFGEVKGYGVGMRMDSSNAMMEQAFVAYMPNGKAGLTTLLDENAPPPSSPPFVGPDTVSYTCVNFEFGGLLDVVRKVVNSNPMLAAQLGEQMPQIEQTVGPIFSALGTKMFTTASASKPFGVNGRKSVTAIECVKQQEFENAISALAANGGIEPRDFLGQRIYTLDPEMLPPMMPGAGEMTQPISLGIGGGFVVIGATSAVEQCLRSTGQGAAPATGANPDFQRAIGSLSKQGGVAWGFSDTISSIEAGLAEKRLQAEKSIEQFREHDPEFADEMLTDLKKRGEAMEKFDWNLVRQYIGPTAWMIRATEDGYEGVSYILSAEGAKKP